MYVRLFARGAPAARQLTAHHAVIFTAEEKNALICTEKG